MKKLPKTLYVRLEKLKGEEPFALAGETAAEFAVVGEKVRLGVYQMVEEIEVSTVVDHARIAKASRRAP